MKIIVFAISLIAYLNSGLILAQNSIDRQAVVESGATREYLKIQVDNIEIDTSGLVDATDRLSGNIERLSVSIDQLAKSTTSLSEQDREAIVAAAQSVDNASLAISRLAEQLPLTAAKINQDLINIINSSQNQIADISAGIQSASHGVIAITQTYPEAVENTKRLANDVIESGLNTVSFYTTAFFVLLFITLAALVYLVYRLVVTPVIAKIDELQTIPAQLAEMSTQMSVTSNNLLKLRRQQRLKRGKIEHYLR